MVVNTQATPGVGGGLAARVDRALPVACLALSTTMTTAFALVSGGSAGSVRTVSRF